jgi:hypothetical protein
MSLHFQRQSNNYRPDFTDQELVTIYLFGIIQKRFSNRQTYDYIVNHWSDWFPKLPTYQAYNHRVTANYYHFEVILNELMQQMDFRDCYADISLVDSLPIILSKRPYSAKVAIEVADKGYCASKKLYYHGLKLHMLSFDRYGHLPKPQIMCFTCGSANDLATLKPIAKKIYNRTIVADKIYHSTPFNTELQKNNTQIITPIKLQKGQEYLDAADKLFSSYVSAIRQPIEALFQWIIHKTDIQNATKVRSENGLWTHCFGRLAAALFIIIFNP